jgi:1-acyl-sn-glycerol-3-phosphate acyltransferase
MTPFPYRIAVVALRLALPLYARIRFTGVENLACGNPVVIASNHLNDADPLILMAHLPRRCVFMAKEELFRVPVFGWVLRALGMLPVRRERADVASLRGADRALRSGLALVVFPEGRTSTRAACLQQARPGVAMVALHAGVDVVPVAITGSQGLQWPRVYPRLFRRPEVRVVLGPAVHFDTPRRVDAEAAQAATRQIMDRIAALLPESYRGYYGGAPATPDVAEPGERKQP